MSIEQNLEDFFAELSNTQQNHSYQTTTFVTTTQNIANHETIDNQDSSLDDFMNILAYNTSPTIPSKSVQTEESINTIEKYQNQQAAHESSTVMNTTTTTTTTAEITNTKNNVKKRKFNEDINRYKTLVVLRLRSDVSEIDLYHHFIGCIKVTLKPCKSETYLKYAFIEHRTIKEAECNFKRPLNYLLFGSKSYVKYAGDSSSLPIGYRFDNERTIVVKNIPENVTEDDLRQLFINCSISKYCPSRKIHHTTLSASIMNKIKTLLGYAFLVYNTVQEASNVIEHADQYQINGQQLIISAYIDSRQL
ncbi:unnamed protein product [Adineta steineri]|uniref:RRM domain-containing protein n=1 Tax=Adineta steineri TaxID=433720 RepID=A0A815XA82_9BILA|nr:unnamed protein product [Adineta steineri]CAF1269913.1 unnamed protein product [Adineta steineri]CAF1554955.1 unnamed protein product [Adineta steineri]CAF1555656.1 unnamed protein product [Adineta steineri]